MISPETRVQIRRYFFAEHWKIGTIAQALDVHPDTVRRAIEVERFQHAEPLRPSMVDPYLPFVRQVLEQHPRLRATRLYHMIRDRGYTGSVEQLRRVVARLRPQPREAFLRLQVFPAEQAQVDWAYFGSVMVGRAKRQLSCFVITLSWSRVLYLEFFFDQTTENFLRGHVRAFQDWSGAPRVILYDNLRSAVLERRGVVVPYRTLHRFCVERCGFGRTAATVRVADGEPGAECQLDFGYLGLLVFVLLAKGARAIHERRGGMVNLSYGNGRTVRVPKGLSVLEASLRNNVPHASVCGGRVATTPG